jgi:outer membrane protein assembly factor BamE (lipoprotein component of BamABCDE complex)
MMSIPDSVPTEQASKNIGETLALCSFIAFVMLIMTCAGVLFYVMNGHPVAITELSKIQQGMSQSEVKTILGEPKRTYEDAWRYAGVTWCYVTIRFDDEGSVESVVHDH